MVNESESDRQIFRYKAAKLRTKISSTIHAALEHKILTLSETHLDYGCGRGNDVDYLQARGFSSTGYDPYWNPLEPKEADIVTLGFVLNVIECPVERSSTLIHAYKLAKKALVVSAIVGTQKKGILYNDGIITTWQTFEKYYSCIELREYIESVLGVRSKRLSQGIIMIPKVAYWKPFEYEKPASVAEALEEARSLKDLLQVKCFIPRGTFLEKYSTVSKRIYYRLRSPNADLPGKNGLCKCLHLGKQGSDRYQWGIEQLSILDQIMLLELRISRLERLL